MYDGTKIEFLFSFFFGSKEKVSLCLKPTKFIEDQLISFSFSLIKELVLITATNPGPANSLHKVLCYEEDVYISNE